LEQLLLVLAEKTGFVAVFPAVFSPQRGSKPTGFLTKLRFKKIVSVSLDEDFRPNSPSGC
jgi:hypothetical protein